MSDQSEKMAILNMLEQGKITADNAAKLLAALGEQDSKSAYFKDDSEREYGSQSKEPAPGADIKKWAFRMGKKIESTAKDLEPKIQKLAGTVAQKSIELADATAKTIKSHKESYEEKTARSSEEARPADGRAASFTAKGTNEMTFESVIVPDTMNEIIFRTPKGHVNIKGYNGDKATVKVSYRKLSLGKDIEFLKSGGVYQLNYNLDEYDTVNIDAYIPSKMFRHLQIIASNGLVSVENVNLESLTVNTTKCHVSAKNVVSDNLKIDNLDGPVLLSNLSGEQILVYTSNAPIDAANTDFKTLKYETTAEAVSVVSQGFYKFNDYRWTIRTSNARLKVILPVDPQTGYDIKASTSLSDVSSSISDLNYVRNERNSIEGKTANYGTALKKVFVELYTSNAPLFIN